MQSHSLFTLIRISLTLCVLSSLLSTAKAVPITATVTGHGIANGLFPKDTPMYFKYVFESNTPDSNFHNHSGNYSAGLMYLEFKIGSYTWTSSTGDLLIFNNHPKDDYYFARIFKTDGIPGPTVGGYTPVALGLDLSHGDASTFLSDALPVSLPDLSKFPLSHAHIASTWGDGPGNTIYNGVIDSWTFDPVLSQPPLPLAPVPDSGSRGIILLLSTGLLFWLGDSLKRPQQAR